MREGGAELRMRSSSVTELCCSGCGSLCTVRTSAKTGIIHTGFDRNRRIVAAATASGMGFAQTKRFFAHLSMPQPMNEKTFHFYKGRINAGVNRAANKHLQKAAEQVRAAYADMNIGIPDRNGILNISISIDGTWQKRGRTSHNGVVTVIEILTGLVVDFIALSNFCQMCETGPQPDDDSYDQWWEGHKNKCQKNIDCSSAAMEVEGARAIFKRSVQLHGFRYTEMLGDGDAKTHAALLAEDPYGGYPIEKIDCVNHVTKRLGTALRNLVQTRKAQHAPIHGRGKLTEERIKKLTNYYGRAIKDNSGDLEAMERAVWASFFHTMSADENHNHTLCPTGLQSWCFFQRAQAENVAPRPHSKSLPPDVAEALDPVYKRLGDPQLLRRCLAGKTQNSNECFHSLLWSMCPKERWASLRTVDTALGISVQRFNKGSTATADILVELELMTSRCTELYAEQEDLARVQSATRKNSNKEREKRKRIDIVRRRERQDRQGREGEVYGPGQF